MSYVSRLIASMYSTVHSLNVVSVESRYFHAQYSVFVECKINVVSVETYCFNVQNSTFTTCREC